MKHHAHVLLLRLTIGALAPLELPFWCVATWRHRLRTKLNNLLAANES